MQDKSKRQAYSTWHSPKGVGGRILVAVAKSLRIGQANAPVTGIPRVVGKGGPPSQIEKFYEKSDSVACVQR